MTCVKVITSVYMMFVSLCLFYPSVDRVQDTVVQDTLAGKPVANFWQKSGKKKKKKIEEKKNESAISRQTTRKEKWMLSWELWDRTFFVCLFSLMRQQKQSILKMRMGYENLSNESALSSKGKQLEHDADSIDASTEIETVICLLPKWNTQIVYPIFPQSKTNNSLKTCKLYQTVYYSFNFDLIISACQCSWHDLCAIIGIELWAIVNS